MARRLTFTEHARGEARRRGIDEASLRQVASQPEQRVPGRAGREIRQSRVFDAVSGKLHLVRIIVEISEDEDTVVTVYRTSKIRKYWSDQ